jgi:alkylation response protein AidB-like acyl-CoA dehydrogenase
VPIPVTGDQRAVADAVRGWAARSTPLATARSQETAPDAWRKHWSDLAALGVFAVAVSEELGGAGGSVVDLAVMLEAAAEALVPGPVASTALAALVLSQAASGELLSRVAAGELPAAVAFDASGLTATRTPDGGIVVDGTTTPVLGAAPDSLLVLGAHEGTSQVWFAVDAGQALLTEIDAADFSRSLATATLTGVEVPADRVLSVSTDTVRDLAAVVFAAEASGVAAWCLRTAVDYAKVREQFGKPIGSFQAIKHLCAEMLLRVEQAASVAWDAAEAIDEAAGSAADGQCRLAAAVAAVVGLDAAVETAKDCIQVLGGIGFTWEHDAHLYLRRALALRQLLGGSAAWQRQVTDLTVAGVRRELHIDLGPGADDERAQVRAEASRIAALPEIEQRAALADAGYLAPHWPRPYGLDASAAEQLLIDQELAHVGVHRPDLVIGAWAVPTILQAGTEAQKERFVGPTLRGDIVWCQLFSEPGAGSDLASLRTRAERVTGGWRLYGQKVWTSVAHRADWGICLARTNPDVPKHKGISYFLVDMKASAGLDIRPLREITGEAMFNEVFLDGVFVPDDLVVGDVDDGWKLARATLVNERIAMSSGGGLDGELEAVVNLSAELGRDGDDDVRRVLGRLISVSMSGALLDVRTTLRQLDGRDVSALSSVRKLIGVRHRQAVAEAGVELLGVAGAQANAQVQAFLMTRCLTIAGGTTQVLLTLAAERILGLPRS